MKGGEGRSSPQNTRSPALWASSGCLQPVEGRRFEAATPFRDSLLPTSGHGWPPPSG